MSVAMVRSALLFAATLAAPLGAQDDGDGDVDGRCLALCVDADEGRFDVAAALAALRSADESVAATAAAIVRHEWPELPRELLEGLEQDRTAMRRMLHELARGPRRSVKAWAGRQALPTLGRTLDHRLLALAACGEPLSIADAGLLLEALREGEVGDGFYLALQLLPERIADGLVGRLHQDLASGAIEVEQLTFVFDRLSPRGVMALLGLAMSLPAQVAAVLVRDVHEHRPELVRERAAAALDGPAAVEPVWLPYCAPLLDRPARVERVMAMLRDGDNAAVREAAFEALLGARIVDRAMLDAVFDGRDDDQAQLLRVLTRAGDAVPAALLADYLGGSNEVAHAAARALQRRRVMEPELQQRVMSLLGDVEAADRSTALDLVTAVMLLGDADAVAEVWPVALASQAWAELLDRFARRTEPFVPERLVAALVDARLAAPPADAAAATLLEEQLDRIALLLCGRGDRRELERLVRRATTAPAAFARRCRLYAQPLPPPQSSEVFRAALADDDPERAADLLEWAATDPGDESLARLWQLWQAPPAADEDRDGAELLLEVVGRVLAGSPRRPALVAALREAWAAGPLPDAWSSLPFELLNTCRADAVTGVSPEDLRLCAELLLIPPLGDREGEARSVARWPDGEFGFPLVSAVATRLRAADPGAVASAFTAVIEQVLADERSANVSRQRLKVFWRALAATPELLGAVGVAMAPLWQRADDYGQPPGDGPGLWFAARRAEADGDLVAAEQLYRRAGRALLRRPATRLEARWLLGEPDAAAGRDPWAELAAAPYRMQLLRARAAGDAVAELHASRLVDEFAAHVREPLADPSRDHHR